MNLAVKFWKDRPNPKAIPGDWPAECHEIGESTTYDDESGYVWTIMSVEQYNAYRDERMDEYNTWVSTDTQSTP